MDSDTDHFESADEELISDHEETVKSSVLNTVKEVHNEVPVSQVKNIVLHDSDTDLQNKDKICEISKQIQDLVDNTNDESTSTTRKKPSRCIERKERPQKNKTKLGTKLGTKITENKDDVFKEKYEEAKKIESKLEIDNDDENFNPSKTENKEDIFTKKYEEAKKNESKWETDDDKSSENFNPSKNFWEKDETKPEPEDSSWGNWGNWGVSSLLSTAQLGVSTITSSVSQSITTVLESGIGVPDPEQLARIDMEEIKKQKDISPEKEDKQKQQTDSLFGLGNLVSGVSHITKLVESTGTKVLTGGLDTLETIGKKTFEVLQEGDPGLKKKRALFKIGPDKPVLSQILREAKEKAEQENKLQQISKKPQYETIFDDYQGLVHLEALEMLSKQCDIKLETLVNSLQGNSLQDMQETMAQIKELCELPDEDEDNCIDIDSVREKIDSSVSEMSISVSYTHFLDTWVQIESWLQNQTQVIEEEIVHQKAITSLAHLTAIAVEQFHKAAELLLVKERRSTVDEADSLLQLTITLTSVVGSVAAKFSEKLNSFQSQNVNNFITNIFLEAANSSSYIQDAFNLMIPILQVGAV